MASLRNALTRLQEEGIALGHFNVADLVLLKAVLAAAGEVRVPIFVGASEGEREFFGTRQLAAVVKSLREESALPVFLNADHTHSLAKAMEAAKAGFDAVGIDFSALPFRKGGARKKRGVGALGGKPPPNPGRGRKAQFGGGFKTQRAKGGAGNP